MSKQRRHHNNKGYRQIKSGSSRRRLQRLAQELGIPFGRPTQDPLRNREGPHIGGCSAVPESLREIPAMATTAIASGAADINRGGA